MVKPWLKKHPRGSLLMLYIQPGAPGEGISGMRGDRLKVRIKSQPLKGEANEALLEFLWEYLGIAKSKIHLMKGESSRQKDVLVELSPEKIISLKPWPS